MDLLSMILKQGDGKGQIMMTEEVRELIAEEQGVELYDKWLEDLTAEDADEYANQIRNQKKIMEFFMPMTPPTTTAQMKKVAVIHGKPHFYEPEKVVAAKAKLTSHLATHVPIEKYTGPVRLTTKWLFPMTKTSADGQYKHTRPDTDNLQKLLKDCMTDLGYWSDDALVASEIVEKFWAKQTGIYIKIEKLEKGGY